MSKIKPSLPKGTRDFLPKEVKWRNYIFQTIRNILEAYGFSEIETPAFERLETLTGKYGDEGDTLLFKILNSGDFLKDIPEETYTERQYKNIVKHIADKGLRYDLTVPLARYVVQHQGELEFPFKRYHVAPVWRADRPQKGRYQEFYQFDADIISADSLLNDVELSQLFLDVYATLKLNVTIKINNRKILQAMASTIDAADKLTAITVAIDKWDKIGQAGVQKEFDTLGLSFAQQEKLFDILQCKDIAALQSKLEPSDIAKKGIDELSYVLQKINSPHLVFDITLARGLNYYTGTIWEVVSNDIAIGSISSGGRYDNLTEMFGGQNMSGIGISFGIERIYDVLQELQLFPENLIQGVRILIVPRNETLIDAAYEIVKKLRANTITCEVFTGNVKKQKHFAYAESKQISYMAEIGEDEINSGIYRVKNLSTREELRLSFDEIVMKLK